MTVSSVERDRIPTTPSNTESLDVNTEEEMELIIRSSRRVPPALPQARLYYPPSHESHRRQGSPYSGSNGSNSSNSDKKKEQVKQMIIGAEWIPIQKVDDQVEWFYNEIGLDDEYFELESAHVISNHIASLYAAKVASVAREGTREEIGLDAEGKDHAIYVDTSERGRPWSHGGGRRYEHRLEERYLDGPVDNKCFRVEAFCSPTTLANVLPIDHSKVPIMRCYFVYECVFSEPNPSPNETNLALISDQMFLRKTTANTMNIYQNIIDAACQSAGPVIEVYPSNVEGSSVLEKRLVVAFRQRTAPGIFSALSDLYHYYGVICPRKYLDNFSNGITVISMYLKAPSDSTLSPNEKAEFIDRSITQIRKEISLLYCIPRNKFQSLFASGGLSLEETIYGHCVWIFVQHFVNRLGPEYTSLVSVLDPKNNDHAEILSQIKRRLRTGFTADYIAEVISQHPDLVRILYAKFARIHARPQDNGSNYVHPAPEADRYSDAELKDYISKTVSNDYEQMVMQAFIVFNSVVLKTNYYLPTKMALSFRLDPKFLLELKLEYPQPLYGMFLVVSSEFRGFHLRFRDIARGGIRIVKSRNREAYSINVRSMFDENYGLANTQQSKNKDIPEGGSKGVILLEPGEQDKGTVAFEKYIDSIIDLLIPQKNTIVDLHGKEEILFMGPDENTADLVDWATEHAKRRGAPWWKSFFTGKSERLGGIPHDKHGMTTLSVREYVTGIYRKLNLDPSKIRKLQTGGPDGDLGSNEILLSNEKYTAIIDGSGVLVDPNGIDHEELTWLAKKRRMISDFDITKLSQQGYRVLVDETDVRIPSGEIISNGTTFRNTFHLRNPNTESLSSGDTTAGSFDMFVPCGGRPESIDLSSVNKLIKDGKCTIPYIVEGANLFITQDAKLRLEAAGCIIYKDASANKGGVTSSSLEVLASLSFDDAGFIENMCEGPNGMPEFYKAYVREVQEIIKQNARLEFEAIWREHEATGTPRSVLSDALSVTITKFDEELQNTPWLWGDRALKHSVLADALPKLLLEKIGLDLIIERVPENYLRSIFGSYLASRFVYQFGSNPGHLAFFDFMNKRRSSIRTHRNLIAAAPSPTTATAPHNPPSPTLPNGATYHTSFSISTPQHHQHHHHHHSYPQINNTASANSYNINYRKNRRHMALLAVATSTANGLLSENRRQQQYQLHEEWRDSSALKKGNVSSGGLLGTTTSTSKKTTTTTTTHGELLSVYDVKHNVRERILIIYQKPAFRSPHRQKSTTSTTNNW